MQFPDDLSGPESSDEEQDVTQLYSSYEEYVRAQVTLDDLFYLEVGLSVLIELLFYSRCRFEIVIFEPFYLRLFFY